MTARIDLGHWGEYTIDNYEWDGTDQAMVNYLNSLLDPSGFSGSDPNPDCTGAQLAIKALPGAKLIECEELEFVEGRVY